MRRWPWVAIAAMLVAAAAAATIAWRSAAGDPAITGTSLVVRPFTGSGDERASGPGLAHAIAARLGGQGLLTIRPEGRAQAGAPGSLVLDGEIAVDDRDVTVTARLLEAVTNRIVWSDRVRVRADQFYDAEAVIAERVASALRLQLAAAEQQRLRRRYTSNAAAYAAFLAGRAALVQYTPAGTRAAVDAFETALRIDPCTRWPGPVSPWRAPTSTCGSRLPTRSSAGPSGPRAKRGRRWPSTPISPKRIWPGPRSRASGSSTGARPSSRAGGRCCSIPTCLRRT